MKHRMHRRDFLQLSASVAGATTLGSVLAACGGSAPAPTESNNKPVTISLWVWNPGGATLDKQVAAFQKLYPNIHVNAKFITNSEFLVALKSAANANALPTVFGTQVGSWQAQFMQYMQPLQDYARASLGADWQSKFVKTGLDQARLVNPPGDTGFYSLPESLEAIFLLVNTSIFQKYNLSIPQTFDELKQVARVLNSKNIAPMLVGVADSWQAEDIFLQIANQAAPGEWYKAQKAGTGFDSPNLVQAMSIWKELFTDNIVQRGATGAHVYPDAYTAFTQGKGAILPLGSWCMQSMVRGPNLFEGAKDWQAILFPKINPTAPQTPLTAVDVMLALSKNASDDEKNAGWKLIQFLTQGEGQKIYVNDMFDLAAQVGVEPTSDILPNAKTMYQQSIEWTKQGTLRFVIDPNLDRALAVALASVATGEATPAAALSKLNGVVNQQQ